MICKECGKRFYEGRTNRRYCSDACRDVAKKNREYQYAREVRAGKRQRQSQAPRTRNDDDVSRPAARKIRRCLKCDRDFNSRGPENRICPACRAKRST
jgi:hypothetical protein